VAGVASAIDATMRAIGGAAVAGVASAIDATMRAIGGAAAIYNCAGLRNRA